MSHKKFAMGPVQFSCFVAALLSDIDIVDGLDKCPKTETYYRIAQFIPHSFRANTYDASCEPVQNATIREFRQTCIRWMDNSFTAFMEYP